MKLLRQGTKDELCGAYTIAMVTEKPLKDVFNAIGHREKMSVPQIHATATLLGFRTEEIAVEGSELEDRGIIILYTKTMTNGHVVAYEDGRIFDCDSDVILNGIEELLFVYNNGDVLGGAWFASKLLKMEAMI